jgi:hypothetical protein
MAPKFLEACLKRSAAISEKQPLRSLKTPTPPLVSREAGPRACLSAVTHQTR